MGEYCELYRVEEAVIRQLIEKKKSYVYFDKNYAEYGGKYHNDLTRHFILSKEFRRLQDLLNQFDPSEDKILGKAILGAPHLVAAAWDSPRYNLPGEVKRINQVVGQVQDALLQERIEREWLEKYNNLNHQERMRWTGIGEQKKLDYFESRRNTLMMRVAALRAAYSGASASGDGIVINIL